MTRRGQDVLLGGSVGLMVGLLPGLLAAGAVMTWRLGGAIPLRPGNDIEVTRTDRAYVIFTDGEAVSSALYTDWCGSAVPSLLDETALILSGPDAPDLEKVKVDGPAYAAATFARVSG